MTQKELIIVSALVEYGHENQHIGAGIKDIVGYAQTFAELMNNPSYGMSEVTARRILPKLVNDGFIAVGDWDGPRKTYYITELGKRAIAEVQQFRITHKKKLEVKAKQLEEVRKKRALSTQ